jgi:hypothetical protein
MVMSSMIGILAYVPVWFRASTGKVQATLVQELTDFVMNGIVAAPPDAPAEARGTRQATAPDRAVVSCGEGGPHESVRKFKVLYLLGRCAVP